MLVAGESNYRYLCGHRSVQFALGLRPMVMILPLQADPVLLIHEGEVADAREETWVEDIRGYPGMALSAGRLAMTVRELGLERARIGVELGARQRMGLPQGTLTDLERDLPSATFTDASNLLETCRMVKSAAEIECVERAGGIAATAHRLMLERVRPGLSVAECERICASATLEAGSDPDARAIVSFGSTPRTHVYRPGDLFHVDFVTSFRGYRADVTRRATFGPASEEQRRDQESIGGLQDRVLASIQPGIPARLVAARFSRDLENLRHPPLREGIWIGHGLGLDLLEPPALALGDETPLEPGMVLTPEPWYVREGGLVMVEDTVLVTPRGCRPLSPLAHHDLSLIPS